MSSPNAPRATPADPLGLEMARALGRLLDQARGAREVLPHLSALERGLMAKGAAAIDEIPEPWVARIASQLASLPLPAEEAPLHQLLDRLAARLRPTGQAADSDGPHGLGDFDPERTVVIREISHSEFLAASDESATTVRLPLSPDR